MPSDWTQWLNIGVWALLVLGTIFCVIGAIGLLRFPDFYTRVHAVGVADTMGAGLILFGCALQEGLTLNALKLITVWGLICLTGPAATHALAKAAFAKGLRVDREAEVPKVGTKHAPSTTETDQKEGSSAAD